MDGEKRGEFALRYLLPAMTVCLHNEFSWQDFCAAFQRVQPHVKDRYFPVEEPYNFHDKSAEFLILLLNKGIVLRSEQINRYHFRHSYYREYLQAKYYVSEMERAILCSSDEPMPLVDPMEKMRLPMDTLRWIGEILCEHCRTGENSITERFMRRQPTGGFLGNCIEILKQSRGQKLSVKFDGLNLSSAPRSQRCRSNAVYS